MKDNCEERKERKMSERSLRRLHRALWQWLHENPTKAKSYWPGWRDPMLRTRWPKQMASCFGVGCFACSAARYRHAKTKHTDTSYCTSCPVKWDTGYIPGGIPCLKEASEYARFTRVRAFSENPEHLAKAKELAACIRDMWV